MPAARWRKHLTSLVVIIATVWAVDRWQTRDLLAPNDDIAPEFSLSTLDMTNVDSWMDFRCRGNDRV